MKKDDSDISAEEFKILTKIFRLQQAKRKTYTKIENLKHFSHYKKKCDSLHSLGFIGYKKNRRCVYITQDGSSYIMGKLDIQKRERLHDI